ncbi:MAG: hypothetical protein GY754_12360 [bacterium]|nr:hypothetical protein [bacterium]
MMIKKIQRFAVITAAAGMILTGCEAGLTNDENSNDAQDGQFSFSEMYERVDAINEEMEELREVNEELRSTVEAHAKILQELNTAVAPLLAPPVED